MDVHTANATRDNGGVVIILPLAAQPTSGPIVPPKGGTAKGMLVGHVGLDVKAPQSALRKI